MLKQISSGGVVFRPTKRGVELLMILDYHDKWTFPKGHHDDKPGQSTQQVAIEEVTEETGIGQLTIVKRLPKTHYKFKDIWGASGELIDKTVDWFLMTSRSPNRPRPQLSEVKQADWVNIDQLDDLPSYTDRSYQRLVEKVKETIRKYQNQVH